MHSCRRVAVDTKEWNIDVCSVHAADAAPVETAAILRLRETTTQQAVDCGQRTSDRRRHDDVAGRMAPPREGGHLRPRVSKARSSHSTPEDRARAERARRPPGAKRCSASETSDTRASVALAMAAASMVPMSTVAA